MNPSFTVPAEYFYALTAYLSSQIPPEQRYRLVTLQSKAQLVQELQKAIDANLIDGSLSPNLHQAARRLHGLGKANDPAPECVVGAAGTPVHDLVQDWLDVTTETTDAFWNTVETTHTEGHLDLVLCALTQNHEDLNEAIKTIDNPAPPADPLDAFAPITSVAELADRTDRQWRAFFWRIHDLIEDGAMPGFTEIEQFLPNFTKPGSVHERIEAFIRYLRKFLMVEEVGADDPELGEHTPPGLDVSQFDIFRRFADFYQIRAGVAFIFGSPWNETHVQGAISDVFPLDAQARAWLDEALRTIDALFELADIGVPAVPNEPNLHFSIMEALYARGFTHAGAITALKFEDFQYALTGTVGYHLAATIYANAGAIIGTPEPSPNGAFKPINPDGRLVNCIPPEHLSPFGPFAYLQELLRVSPLSTCDNPLPASATVLNQQALALAAANRRGNIGSLHVTGSNLDIPIPIIDMVNESLEFLTANLPGSTSGVIYDTAMSELETHHLRAADTPENDAEPYQHEPVTLLEALPEHASPAVPVKSPGAYDLLRNDFTAPELPYSQPLDVLRTYLGHLDTTRYAVMRRFRKEITTFVLSPEHEPTDFQRHLWRYPVRCEIAIEYLGINPEEYEMLFSQDIALVPTPSKLLLYELYGFESETIGNIHWTQIVAQVPEFLDRTGLNYCEFVELWKSEFVKFSRVAFPRREHEDTTFPECEACCLDDYIIHFDDPEDANTALARLIVFIRLWRKLQHAIPGTYHFAELWKKPYSFAQLKDLCDILGLYLADGAINPDFICQLAAFQMLRDHFALNLTDGSDILPGATGANRTHLLALWVEPGAIKWPWTVDHLIEKIQHYAQKRLDADKRDPEFIKLLTENLNPLSRLIGFNPNKPEHRWHASPRHTLRFAEALAKIYASEFGIGEILFLFTADDHLDGDDPFELQTDEELSDMPFDFADDEPDHDLWALRRKLLEVEVSEEDSAAWTWARIEAALPEEFGYTAPVGVDPLLSLGKHFFPELLEASGYSISVTDQQYRINLVTPSPAMWNTAPDGPFRYDTTTKELWTQLPITDDAALYKISRIRQLNAAEQHAVRDLYFSPRVDLARFCFIFDDFAEAQVRLIQEPDEAKRWSYFQQAFARFYRRCEIIAQHLTEHVIAKTGQPASEEGYALAWRLLQHLYADENRATSAWEKDNGTMPGLTWEAQPLGGAFTALLGLTGTGLFCEYSSVDGSLLWRELRGGTDAFSGVLNGWNAPVPMVIPAMDATLTPQQANFVGLHNGFAFSSATNERLGGIQGFRAVWSGSLLVENDGKYQFFAGSPTEQLPDYKAAEHRLWRITLERGQRKWILLNNHWPGEDAPAPDTTWLNLRRGVYHITIEFEQPTPKFDRIEDICPQVTGFQLKYVGPDTCGETVTVPLNRLFYEYKNESLDIRLENIDGAATSFLHERYVSTIRDVRRTYERVFKALLFAHRFSLSAQKRADSGQSEIGYMLDHAEDFTGTAYYKPNANFISHKAFLNFNFLPIDEIYFPPPASQDSRVNPSTKRHQAMFDWWERIFDYVDMRTHTQIAPERPVWLLFHEAAEAHEDNPAHLLRHMGVDHTHAKRVLRYYLGYEVTSSDLEDERWAVRVWRAETWIDAVMSAFYCQGNDIRPSHPDLWAGDDPIFLEAGELETANLNLTRFVRRGLIENEDLRRYIDIKNLNDALRLNARAALIAYLCEMSRVSLPWGGHVEKSKDLSDLLLMDVDVGICEKASRVEEAITALQILIQRARLGLEPGLIISPALVLVWDRRFATYRIWEACKRREVYRENWIDWDELEKARHTEAFRYLEDQLRRTALTIPVPGGLEYWDNPPLPPHSALTLLQRREPAIIERLTPAPEQLDSRYGFGLRSTPDRHARPSWLAPIPGLAPPSDDPGNDNGSGDDVDTSTPVPLEPDDSDTPILFAVINPPAMLANAPLPYWIEAAVRLGARFVRVAAAGIPPASATFEPHTDQNGCCPDCSRDHEPLMDEYYFWLIDGRYYESVKQEAVMQSCDWHNLEHLPTLLHWEDERLVYMAWCRVHNGEFQTPRWSNEGVRFTGTPDLKFLGRLNDSLHFEVLNSVVPLGYPLTPPPGFRYDLATDDAVVLPLITEAVDALVFPGGLPVYPYFAHFVPGSQVMPPSRFSPALAVAGALRAHCRYEAALKWYEYAFSPVQEDLAWCLSLDIPDEPEEPEEPDDPNGNDEPVPGTPVPIRDTADGLSLIVNETSPAVVRRSSRFPSLCCAPTLNLTDEAVQERSITLHYLETMRDWGDALMRLNTPDAFQQARLIYDAMARMMGEHPRTVLETDDTETEDAPLVLNFVPDFPALNPRLLSLYEQVDERLSLIHACLNARRLKNGRPNIEMPYWGNNPLRDAWQSTAVVCLDDEDWCWPPSPYRFMFLVQKAQELADAVRGLGASLLAAYEKGDAEYLAALRAGHERQLLSLVLSIRQNQWRDADWQAQALQKAKEHAQERLRYYEDMIAKGLNAEELQYENWTDVSIASRTSGNILEAVGQVMHFIPDLYVGFPCTQTHIPLGSKLAAAFSATARIAFTVADIANTNASLDLTQAGWVRREQEWHHQTTIIPIEIEQIERQILGAERRRDAALRELNNHQRQIEQSTEVLNFLRDKFTNHALYLWHQKETAALYEKMYGLGLHTARQAQRAFNYERGHTARTFITDEIWDTLHEGLLAGERLQFAVRQMEKDYLDANVREYELTKHISLRLHLPLAFMYLKATGYCEIELPEWLFDLDYPGQYMRRVKNVSLTLPCVVGPYTGIHCRLTLLSSSTRVDPRLRDPKAECCDDYEFDNGYAPLPDDPRIVRQYAAMEAIATSTGQNDPGVFELNFRDERYLPFEFAGAVSRWRIELPPENNYFDMDTLSDVVLHLNYTAREGGDVLRTAASEMAQYRLPDDGWRLFEVKHDFPNEWQRFQGQLPTSDVYRGVGIRLMRHMFPYLPGNRNLAVQRLVILFEAEGAVPSTYHTLELMVGQLHGDRRKCEIRNIVCTATAEWDRLFVGVYDLAEPLYLPAGKDAVLGTLLFPECIGDVPQISLLCQYKVIH